LSGQRDDHHAALPAEQVRHAFSAVLARAEIVRADKENAFRFRRVRIDADDRYALQQGMIDRIIENLWIRYGHKDSGRMLRHRLLERSEFLIRRKSSRTHDFYFHAHLFPDVGQAGGSFLPVRKIDIGRHKDIMFILLVVRLSTSCSRHRHQRNAHSKNDSIHFRSPFQRLPAATLHIR
jgi:hypothetical protein